MANWRSRVEEFRNVSLKTEFLDARIQNEQRAKTILNIKSGKFGKTDFIEFLDACNREIVPPNIHTDKLNNHETCTRFQLSFNGKNRNLMLNTLAECNKCIYELWQSRDNSIYHALERFWQNKRIKGAGIGLPTMIMYLKDPNKYNVWIPFLSDALGIFAGKVFGKTRNVDNYIEYNDYINRSLRQLIPDNRFKPQEIDYILFRIGRS